jgi:transporter family protein
MRGRSWGARRMLLLGLVPVCLFCAGDLALFRAIELGPASIVTPLSGMYPIVTLLYAWPVLKERVTARQGLAVALSLLSILLMSLG